MSHEDRRLDDRGFFSIYLLFTHEPPGLVVVQVDARLHVSGAFSDVEEGPGEAEAVVDVVRAAAPLPGLAALGAALPGRRARALEQLPQAAGPRHRVRHPRRRNRVRERRLSVT